MADDDSGGPSLTPPKLFGRRKARDTASPTPPDSATQAPTASVPPAEASPVADEHAFADAGRDVTVVEAPLHDDVPDAAPDAEPVAAPRRARRLRRGRTGADLSGVTDATVEPAPEPREPREPATPLLTGRAAAVVAGLVAGGLLVGLTWLGFRGCEAIQGTSSCGKGPGMVALVAIFVLSIVAGRYLLAAFRVPDPGATSFLGVGLTGVIALLFLVDVLDTWSMAIVIPAITAATFLLSWWVTTTYVDSPDS